VSPAAERNAPPPTDGPLELRSAALADPLPGFGRLVALAVAVTACVNAYGLWAWWFGGGNLFRFVRLSYDATTLALPAVLLALCGYGLWRWRRGRHFAAVLKRPLFWLAAALGLLAVRVYATHIEPARLQVRTEKLSTDAFGQPVRLLHISDIQSAGVGAYEAEAFERMARLRPSLVVHTGDLLHPISPASYPSELPAIAELMARIEAPLGKYNVLGDTDGPIAEELRQGVGGFVTLVNEGVAIEKDGQRIRLFGLGNAESHDPHLARQKVERWLGSIEEGPFRIVVGHAPDFALTMTDLPVDLCLAGHTHGGQIRLPGVGPLITLSRVPRDWARGFRSIGTAALNVSAGIGTEHAEGLPPIRVYCPPEMTLLDLRPTG